MKTIKERKKQYVVTGLHCLLNHLIIFGVMWSGVIILLNSYSHVDYDLLSYGQIKTIAGLKVLRWNVPILFFATLITCWRFYFPVRKQLLVFEENGVKITRPWAFSLKFPWGYNSDDEFYYRWTQIKYIMFDVVYDTIEIKPTYGRNIRISTLNFLLLVNFYHMAKAIKEYSGDDDIVIATKPLWHCYLIHGNSKKKEPKKRKKHTPPRKGKQNHY